MLGLLGLCDREALGQPLLGRLVLSEPAGRRAGLAPPDWTAGAGEGLDVLAQRQRCLILRFRSVQTPAALHGFLLGKQDSFQDSCAVARVHEPRSLLVQRQIHTSGRQGGHCQQKDGAEAACEAAAGPLHVEAQVAIQEAAPLERHFRRAHRPGVVGALGERRRRRRPLRGRCLCMAGGAGEWIDDLHGGGHGGIQVAVRNDFRRHDVHAGEHPSVNCTPSLLRQAPLMRLLRVVAPRPRRRPENEVAA
mmetsp:Transcript_60201/g.176678  ORF Transcript_60201/g.176678 Transcript_60201/m.176678 type:complete len:249 (-) Transcript_60201:162-908(-)